MERDSVIKKIPFRLAVALVVAALVACYFIADYALRTTLLDCALDGADPGAIRSVEIVVKDAYPMPEPIAFLTITVEDDPAFYADLLAVFETITVRPRLFKPGPLYFQPREAYNFTFDIDGLLYAFSVRNKDNMSIYARPNEQNPHGPYRIVNGENLPAIYDLLVRYGYIPPDQEADPT